MSRRIQSPVNRAAFGLADAEFRNRYAVELGHPDANRPGTRRHRKLRDKWLDLYQRHGGAVDDGKSFQQRLPDDIAEPCPLKNEIVEVEFLDGDDVTLAAGAVTQHVNLPRAAKFVDGVQVTNIDRLGRTVRARVRFARAKKETFKVALLSHRKNAVYTGTEKGNRGSFDYVRATSDKPQGDYTKRHGVVYSANTRSDGTAIIELGVTPAGGDRYKLVAWDVNGKVVYSASVITTTRTIFYATFLADDPNNVRMDQVWFRGKIERKYRKRGVNLVFLGAENINGMVYSDIDDADTTGDQVLNLTSTRNSNLGRIYDDYKPYLLCFCFVDHVANARKKAFEAVSIDNVPPGSVIDVPIYTQGPVTRAGDPLFDWRKALWVGLGPAKYDKTTTGSDWFERASLTLHHLAGDAVVDLAAGDLTLVDRVGAPGAKCEVQIDVSGHFVVPTRVTVNIEGVFMNRSVLGSALAGKHKGIALQPARSGYQPIPREKQLASAIHEAGHALGMCPSTALQGLQHTTLYDYNGQHCHAAIAAQLSPADYQTPPLKDTGTCVMYGLIPDAAPNLNFCKPCRKLLRKIDLGGGLYLA